MWKDILEFGKRVLALTRKVEQHDDRIRELGQEINKLNARVDLLAEVTQRLLFELERDRDIAARERENLLLRLENAMLRFERRLPPGSDPADPTET
jgi:hypothetical protein